MGSGFLYSFWNNLPKCFLHTHRNAVRLLVLVRLLTAIGFKRTNKCLNVKCLYTAHVLLTGSQQLLRICEWVWRDRCVCPLTGELCLCLDFGFQSENLSVRPLSTSCRGLKKSCLMHRDTSSRNENLFWFLTFMLIRISMRLSSERQKMLFWGIF